MGLEFWVYKTQQYSTKYQLAHISCLNFRIKHVFFLKHRKAVVKGINCPKCGSVAGAVHNVVLHQPSVYASKA